MSKHVGIYYECDRCGKQSRPGFINVYLWQLSCLPLGWQEFGKMHFCRSCAERYKEISRKYETD